MEQNALHTDEAMKLDIGTLSVVPEHVAIIMDGNRRWARRMNKGIDMPLLGHEHGYQALYQLVKFIAKLDKITTLTVYAFSTENWKRSKDEVEGLLRLATQVFNEKLNDPALKNVRIRVLGSRERLSRELIDAITEIEKQTENNTGLLFVVALNYGGHWDISEGCKRALLNNKEHKSDSVNVHFYLPSGFLPPVDLLIRTGGEQRTSNFLPWQLAYAEFLFLDLLWPDFTPTHFVSTLRVFNQRVRRFGTDGCSAVDIVEKRVSPVGNVA